MATLTVVTEAHVTLSQEVDSDWLEVSVTCGELTQSVRMLVAHPEALDPARVAGNIVASMLA